MPPSIAAIVWVVFIGALFVLNRDRETPASPALWIPVIWVAICASRPLSMWLGGVKAGPEAASGNIEGNSLDATIYAGLLLVGLVVLFRRSERTRTILRANIPLLLFFFYCLVSVSWSDYPMVAFKRWTKDLGDLVAILIVVTDPAPTPAMKRLLARPGFVLVPLSLLLIKYYSYLGREYGSWFGEAYNIGVATGKNGLGFVCLVFGLGCLWNLFEVRRDQSGRRLKGPIIAQIALLFLVIYTFRLADSATSLSCFVMGGFILAIIKVRAISRRPVLVTLLIGTMLFVVIYATLLNPGSGLLGVVGRDSTLTGRTEVWHVALSIPVSRIFGAGYESFWVGDRLHLLWKLLDNEINQAHDGYLQVYLDLGIIGVVLLGIVILWGYRNILRALRLDPEFGRLRLAFFYVALVYNLTEHAFRDLHPVWQAFLFAVVAVPLPPPPEPPPLLDTDRADHAEPLPQAVGVQGGQMISGRLSR